MLESGGQITIMVGSDGRNPEPVIVAYNFTGDEDVLGNLFPSDSVNFIWWTKTVIPLLPKYA